MHTAAMDYRNRFVASAVSELRHQLGPEAVEHHGTSVQVEDSFNMARLAEAVIKGAVFPNTAIVEEVARTLAPAGEDWEGYRDPAEDVLAAIRGAILTQLDPPT